MPCPTLFLQRQLDFQFNHTEQITEVILKLHLNTIEVTENFQMAQKTNLSLSNFTEINLVNFSREVVHHFLNGGLDMWSHNAMRLTCVNIWRCLVFMVTAKTRNWFYGALLYNNCIYLHYNYYVIRIKLF